MAKSLAEMFRKIKNVDEMEPGTWEVWMETHAGMVIHKYDLPEEKEVMFDFMRGCRFADMTYHVFDTKGNLTNL